MPFTSCAGMRQLCLYIFLIWTHCSDQEHLYTYISHYWCLPLDKCASTSAEFRWRRGPRLFHLWDPSQSPTPMTKGRSKSVLNKIQYWDSIILKWSARIITEGLFRDYIALWQHVYKRPMTVSKILYTLAGSPLGFEALGFSLPSL